MSRPPTALPTIPDPRPLAVILASHLTIGIAINLFCAILATYALHVGKEFRYNLVYSMCIGMLALLFIDGGRMLLWGRYMPPRLPFIGLVTVAMPTAKLLGNAIASRLLGLDTENAPFYPLGDPTGMFIFTVLTGSVVSWFFWTNGQVALLRASVEAERARAAAIEKQALQAQLQVLQAQIEPHMLFNTLANLQGLIAVDAKRAQHMLDQLIQYLRATLSASRSAQTTLEQEFALLDAYLGLMSVRMGTRLSYALHLPDALRETMIPPMLMQPLVENAIRHGLEPKIGGGRIDIAAAHEAGTLALSVADTGLGLDGPQQQPGTRVGVSNIRERLRALYGQYASLTLHPNTPAGAIAQIRIPL
ncbi:sensor histidine kinase [Noviherbaspirillum autotrophicum]|uniref:Histidine kinase n=1 Tax=Noviherbaspirillum autotrophicum TaxID=709839 RepID=A0A0C2BUW4_9BURK|nr:histidine kinase [Noviherbaspirillum autotrophicum]KIF81816.1 histidine kinase [Noviherbaspirillum autotrophicum]